MPRLFAVTQAEPPHRAFPGEQRLEHGIEGNRLVAKGYGETKPLVPNLTPIMKQKNRRVQFVIQPTEGVQEKAPTPAKPATTPATPAEPAEPVKLAEPATQHTAPAKQR